MEQNNIQTFDFEGHQTRVVMKDGAPWWVGKDVCDVLGYANAPDTIKKHCKHKGVAKCYTLGGEQEMVIIPESDVYRLIIRSNMPEAERFETWVMEEVLPSIRKHGAYVTPQKIDEVSNNHDALITLVEALKDERNKVKELEQRFEDNAIYLLSGRDVQESLISNKTMVTGQFVNIQRAGNVILLWMESNDVPVRALIGKDTELSFEKGCQFFHLEYKKGE